MIPFHRPSITEDEIASVVEVLRSGWLTTGKVALEFEERFASLIGTRHAIAVNSATSALHLALEAFGVGLDDEVVIPTYTFTACGAVVEHLGADVILADVSDDYLLEPEQLAAVVTGRTRAVVPVHFAGQVADVAALRKIAPDAAFLEDAAHALPVGKVGTLGDAAAFSFYATKTLTTGEGGMLVTDDDAIAERARRMRLHGIDAEAWSRYGPGNHWAYSVEDAGYKYNLPDLLAALGIAQLRRLYEMKRKRAAIAALYDKAFGGSPVDLPLGADDHAWHLYVIQVDEAIRDEVIDDLAKQDIGASVHFMPLHLHPHYQRMGYRPGQFPVAERLYRRSISLPIWPDMTQQQVDRVASSVIEAVAAHSD